MYPEVPTASAEAPDTQATSPLPSTPSKTDAQSVDYEKALVSDDEEAYLEEFTAGGADSKAGGDTLNTSLGDLNASVTSNFTEKFFPPSPTASKERAAVDIPAGDALATPSTPARSVQPTPSDPPATPDDAPPTQYILNIHNDPAYEDDISTIANDTYVAKYMSDNPNQLPPTPKSPHHTAVKGYPERPNSPDNSAGANQPTHVYTYNKLPKGKPAGKAESSTSEESGVASRKKNGDAEDNKSVYSFASSYRRFKGGSGWSRRNYIIAIIMTLFLLAVIAGLAYTFVRLQSQQQEKQDNLALQQRPDANGGMNQNLPDGDNVFGDGWTLRPTGAPVPTPEPTITRSHAPSPIGPSPRPTRAPTTPPTRRPTTSPSLAPTGTPTTPLPTGTPSVSPTMTPEEVLRSVIQAVTSPTTMQAIGTPGTAQQKAFDWLIKDPNFSNITPKRVKQRFALAVLYYSFQLTNESAEALQTWMQYDTNECSWFTSWFENRLACGSDDIFKFLTLKNINLIGTIPSEIAMLTKLNSLDLSNNALTGTIPNEFGDWDSLTNLDLQSNFLGGKIPGLRNLGNLVNLDLSNNRLTGSMPDSLVRLYSIDTLDLTNNEIYGFCHDRLCNLQPSRLAVDCNRVDCSCATSCNADETRAPVALPGAPPTAPPTPVPTPQPTPAPGQCVDAIQVTKSCFQVGEVIIANFRNCNPLGNDWVGIYPENVNAGQHFNPHLWKWSCNSQQCFEAIGRGTVFMDLNASGGVMWPLPPGTYRAWLFARGGDGGAYPAKAGSTTFIVRNGQCF